GSLDRFGMNRASLMANLDAVVQASEQNARRHAAGQVDLFGAQMAEAAETPVTLARVAEWNPSQRLAGERETLGLYLTGHPIAPYDADLAHLASGRIADFAGDRPPAPTPGPRPFAESRPVTLAGLILEVRRRGTRVSFMLDDRSARMEVTLFEET